MDYLLHSRELYVIKGVVLKEGLHKLVWLLELSFFSQQALVACKLYKSMAHEADEDNLEVDISEQFLNDGK